ncbi:MAG: DUF5606 domain-containing protein [Prevotellaceae bacterium]|jgi:hypothetical protein|nr:DUF5606 domain-containing protein [Prevotellaceae bacterium]
MQTNLQKIVSIANYHGLYRYLSQARLGMIVENLQDGKRSCLPPSAKASPLSDITIFTTADDLMLKDIFLKIKDKYEGKQILSHKSPTNELLAFFEKIVPEYSRDRVFPSHIKKIVEWYNTLQKLDMLDFVSNEAGNATDNAADDANNNEVEQKSDSQ